MTYESPEHFKARFVAKLADDHAKGIISEADYQERLAVLLAGPPSARVPPQAAVPTRSFTERRAADGKVQLTRQVRYVRNVIVGLVVLVIIIVIATSGHGGGGPVAKITPRVENVVALDGNTVRVYIAWINTGKAAGSENCVMNTTVIDQFGDQVNVEVNTTNTNGNVKPGRTQLLYQDIGVNGGDAQFIQPSDVKLVDC